MIVSDSDASRALKYLEETELQHAQAKAVFAILNTESRQSKEGLWTALRTLVPGRYRVTVTEAKSTRSIEQNSRYWGYVLPTIAEQVTDEIGKKYSAEIWHEYFKQEFIGIVELPNERVVGKSSRKLSVTEFADFMTQVEAWAVERGVTFRERE